MTYTVFFFFFLDRTRTPNTCLPLCYIEEEGGEKKKRKEKKRKFFFFCGVASDNVMLNHLGLEISCAFMYLVCGVSNSVGGGRGRGRGGGQIIIESRESIIIIYDKK